MWTCDQCGAEGEAHFEVCWQCGAPRTGAQVGDAGASGATRPDGTPHGPAGTHLPSEAPEPPPDPGEKTCLACGAAMAPRGEVPIRVDGPDGWTLFRGLAELNERLWRVEVWACTGCRRLDLYEGE